MSHAVEYEGHVALAQAGLAVETRILARACYENMFCVGGLIEKGDDFVAAMQADDIKSLMLRGKFVVEKIAPAEGGSRTRRQAVQSLATYEGAMAQGGLSHAEGGGGAKRSRYQLLNSVRGIYNGAEWLSGRREVLQWWADHIDGTRA